MLLELGDVTKTYRMGEETVFALRGVSLAIEAGDFVAIMGPSGSGKSTLMHVLGLLDVPSGGRYAIAGRAVAGLNADELAVLRRETIGFIFQQFNLLPRMSAWENVALPLLYSAGEMNAPKAQELLERVGLGTRIQHRPNELSGGQQQRVAIARALVNTPRIILADEPTGNLDSISEREVINILKALNDTGITIIIVTHEEEIGRQAKRIVRMRDGAVQSDERLAPLMPPPQATATTPYAAAAHPQAAQITQHLRQGVKTLAANKVRTALSMLGILIGVAAVVAMLALGRGAQAAIEQQLASLGSNLLVLRAGATRVPGGAMGEAGSTTRITLDDAATIQELPHVRSAAPTVNGRGQVTYLNKNWNTQILGVAPSYAQMHAAVPDVGRFFSDDENKKRLRLAVIGATVARELFSGASPIGETIKINKVSFQVIGLLPEKGATSYRDQDDVIAIPVLTAMHRLLGKDYIDSVDVEVDDPAATDTVQQAVLNLMFTRHRVAVSQQRDAFQLRNMADIQAALSESTRTMTLLLSIIAAISLLVGGIGIMNIMLISVTERTREIGLRKAVGARRGDILMQFLVEAMVVSAVGGIGGIVLAWLVTLVLSAVSGWATAVTPASVALAFFFSAGIGVLFGIYPARKAATLNPIDALRHE